MDLHEREEVATVVNFLLEKSVANGGNVNEKVAQVAYKALEAANVCSNNMDFVPRPAYGALDIKYVLLQLGFVSKRVINNDTNIYIACKSTVVRNFRTELQAALMGI